MPRQVSIVRSKDSTKLSKANNDLVGSKEELKAITAGPNEKTILVPGVRSIENPRDTLTPTDFLRRNSNVRL